MQWSNFHVICFFGGCSPPSDAELASDSKSEAEAQRNSPKSASETGQSASGTGRRAAKKVPLGVAAAGDNVLSAAELRAIQVYWPTRLQWHVRY
eukprot:1438649-Rhodomonas_salina.1